MYQIEITPEFCAAWTTEPVGVAARIIIIIFNSVNERDFPPWEGLFYFLDITLWLLYHESAISMVHCKTKKDSQKTLTSKLDKNTFLERIEIFKVGCYGKVQ